MEKQSESLELVPLPPTPEVREVPVEAPQAAAKPEESSALTTFFYIASGLLMVALLVAGVLTAFDWILGSNLKQTLMNAPLKVASYLFVTAISILAGMEISNLIVSQKNKLIRRSYVLSIMVAGMLGYGLFYMHLQMQIRPPDLPILIAGTTAAGAVAGWSLPTLLEEEPYGTLSYLMLLVLLIAFTWLARFEAIPTYGWAAFAAMVCYFFRSAMIAVRRSVVKRQSPTLPKNENANK